MTDPTHKGICPNCDFEGEVGSPCTERACNLRGYHFIPREYATWTKTKRPDATVGKLIGRYLAVKVLGSGGFGTVHLALQHAMLSKKAAVKVLHPQEDPAVLAMLLKKFKAEAEALAVVSHPNVVQLLEYGTQDDSPYMVMEFVEGARTLKDEIQKRVLRGEGFTVAEVQSLLEQTVNGLEAAHSKGIIHRDIKPENLMLQTVAGNPLLVRIVDFGLAKFTEAGTRTSKAMGTPTYMAPEQLHQAGLGPWTDLYAVGVVAFELLTGRLPFPGRTSQEVVVKKIDPAYDPLSQVSDLHLQDGAVSFLRRALARDAENRYRTTEQFRMGLIEACKTLDATDRKCLSSDLTALLDQEALQEFGREKNRLEPEVSSLGQVTDEEKRLLEGGPRRFRLSKFVIIGVIVIICTGLLTLVVMLGFAKPSELKSAVVPGTSLLPSQPNADYAQFVAELSGYVSRSEFTTILDKFPMLEKRAGEVTAPSGNLGALESLVQWQAYACFMLKRETCLTKAYERYKQMWPSGIFLSSIENYVTSMGDQKQARIDSEDELNEKLVEIDIAEKAGTYDAAKAAEMRATAHWALQDYQVAAKLLGVILQDLYGQKAPDVETIMRTTTIYVQSLQEIGGFEQARAALTKAEALDARAFRKSGLYQFARVLPK